MSSQCSEMLFLFNWFTSIGGGSSIKRARLDL